jgi:predicted nucleic acid-binding protein
VPVDSGVAEIASDLRAAHNLRTPDAIHLATALQSGAEAFVSQDDRLRNLPIQDLRVLSLDQVFR